MADWVPPEVSGGGWAPPEAGGAANTKSPQNVNTRPSEVFPEQGELAGGLFSHQSAAGLGDMIFGIPRMLLETGAEASARAVGTLAGEDRKTRDQSAAAFGQRVGQMIPEWMNAPFEGLYKAAGFGDVYARGVPQQLMKKISDTIHEGAEAAPGATKGKLSSEDVEWLAKFAMTGMTLKGLSPGAPKAPNRGKLGYEAEAAPQAVPEDLIAEFKKTGAGGSPEKMKRDIDAQRNAEKAAYDLMQRGASTKEVEALIKGNPRVGAAMEQIRQSRADAAYAFDRDFGARQGEVLPPDGLPSPGKVETAAEVPRLSGPQEGTNLLHTFNPLEAGKSLFTMLMGGKYSAKTLNRLPGNRIEFSKEEVQNQLARQDVTAAEREILGDILKEHEGNAISAADLVNKFRMSTGDFVLRPADSGEWAEYGLERIRGDSQGSFRSNEFPSSTTRWQLPFAVSKANHFSDPQYFAHTRSFMENGVKHFTELQSDLAQKAAGVSAASMKASLDRVTKLEQELKTAREEGVTFERTLQDIQNDLDVAQAEYWAKQQSSGEISRVDPMLKYWYRRIIREEMNRAAGERRPMVRWASADTVAKVEGWHDSQGPYGSHDPTQPRFQPAHQSIYDRYTREITKFLKSLGGKEYTDHAGHTWIEVPTADFMKSAQTSTRGTVEMFTFDPVRAAQEAFGLRKDMKKEAFTVFQDHGEGAARDFISAFQTLETGKQGIKGVESLIGARINDLMARQRVVANEAKRIVETLPRAADREAVSAAIDAGLVDKLPPELKGEARRIQSLFAEIGDRALEAGVVKGLRENYITHVVDWKASAKTPTAELLDMIIGRVEKASNSPTSRFGKARKYATFEELQRAIEDSGLALKTKDVGEIYRIYANSMEKAILNRNLVNNLKNVRDVAGQPFLKQISEKNPIPHGWTFVDAPGLRNWAASPEIAEHLKFVFDSKEPGTWLKGAHSVSQFVKRVNVVGSLFHAKSLAEAALMAVGPTQLVKSAMPGAKGMHTALEQFRRGGLGDEVDFHIKNGLVVEIPEDVTVGLMTQTGKAVDHLLSRGGVKTRAGEASLGAAEKVLLHQFDKFTWDYLHAGLKPYTQMVLYEKALRKNPGVDKAQLSAEIAKFTNSAYGGQNWFELATSFQNEFVKKLALGAFNKQGRMAAQTMLFALDWTTSAWRTMSMAAGKGTGLKGLANPTKAADFARLYQLRTALTYLTLIDGINYAVSGHHLWDNRDPTRIEFPDGTSIQPMKHAAEPYHWVSDPSKQLANKLGFLPKAAAIGLGGVEYLSPNAPKMRDTSAGARAKRIAEQALPFQASSAISAPPGKGLERAVMGTLGFPSYGTPKSPAQQAASQRARERRERALESKKRKAQ